MLREFVNKPGGFPIARAKGGSVSREELEGIKATEDDGGFEFDFKKKYRDQPYHASYVRLLHTAMRTSLGDRE